MWRWRDESSLVDCTSSWEKTRRSGQIVGRRQSSSQTHSARITGKQVTPEVQLVRFTLHLLPFSLMA